jgi:uncharacterized protein (DUF952 family)
VGSADAIKTAYNQSSSLRRNIMTQAMPASVIYKICSAALWRAAVFEGVFKGAPIDLQDGFIHFSDANQVAGTAAKHFAGQTDLLLLHVDTARLDKPVKWETSRGGALFPHLYGALSLDAVAKVEPLPLGPDGRHIFPSLTG